MELNKYGKLAEKHLKENKPEFYDRLVKDNNLNTFLEDVQKHLNNYASLVEFELRAKYPFPDNNELNEIVSYIKTMRIKVDYLVEKEISLI
jgi:hypothetical protein